MMKKELPRKIFPLLALFFLHLIFLPPASVLGAWYFQWSCGSPIGRPGGREGPYTDRNGCESALSRARSACENARGSFSGGCSGSDEYRPAMGSRQPAADGGGMERRQEEEFARLEQERQRGEAEEEARRRRDEEAREKFDKSRREAMELLKGSGSDTLTIKSGSGHLTTTSPFGIKGTPESGLKIRSDMPGDAVDRSVKAWACAGWIADFAFPAARKGDVGEVRFLEEQVGKALRGEKTGVDCPEIAPPPGVQGVAIGPGAPAFKFYEALTKAVSIQSERIVKARKEIADSLGKQQVTDEDIRKLEGEQKAQEKAKTTAVKKDGIEDPSLAIALEALKKAREAKNKIDGYEAVHKKVQENPSLAGKFIEKIEQ